MTSPAEGSPAAEPCGALETAISTALAGLDNVRELPVSEHVERFEAVHAALTDALSSAERLLSGSNGYGS